jgi:hypothetical protein
LPTEYFINWYSCFILWTYYILGDSIVRIKKQNLFSNSVFKKENELEWWKALSSQGVNYINCISDNTENSKICSWVEEGNGD